MSAPQVPADTVSMSAGVGMAPVPPTPPVRPSVAGPTAATVPSDVSAAAVAPVTPAAAGGGAPFTPKGTATALPPIIAAPAWLSQGTDGMPSGPAALARAGMITNRKWSERDESATDTVVAAREAAATGWKVELTPTAPKNVVLAGDVVAGHDASVPRVMPEWGVAPQTSGRRSRRRR